MSLRQAGSTAPAMFGNAAVSTPAAPAADSK
jgi:hypothetical protein